MPRRCVFDGCPNRVPVDGRKGGKIPEPRALRCVPIFSDPRSAIRVADKNRWSVLCCQGALGNRDVILQRYRWILDDADVVTVLLQDSVYTLPTRAIYKTTMNQNDILHNLRPHTTLPIRR